MLVMFFCSYLISTNSEQFLISSTCTGAACRSYSFTYPLLFLCLLGTEACEGPKTKSMPYGTYQRLPAFWNTLQTFGIPRVRSALLPCLGKLFEDEGPSVFSNPCPNSYSVSTPWLTTVTNSGFQQFLILGSKYYLNLKTLPLLYAISFSADSYKNNS